MGNLSNQLGLINFDYIWFILIWETVNQLGLITFNYGLFQYGKLLGYPTPIHELRWDWKGVFLMAQLSLQEQRSSSFSLH
jgi:hypothetical protein